MSQHKHNINVMYFAGESADIYKEVDHYQRHEKGITILIGTQIFKTEGVQTHFNITYCQDLVVLDTQGLIVTKRKPEEIFEELCKCTAITAPEHIYTLDEFFVFFSEEIYKYVIFVFTHEAWGRKLSTIGYYLEEKFKATEEAFRKRIPKIQQEDKYKETILAKKLQEEKDNVMQEQQLKEKEKLEKDAYAARLKRAEANTSGRNKNIYYNFCVMYVN
ncbi:hypothetical protein ACJMK2_007247 [Sinanodonta woodiana]|uniref:Uncharacterized protein n=1 Tax=Sinanodonta woodiana TaxID=1069815 RepID=A0ABD3VID2_SINWO